jgi:hypothetical protein
VLSCACAGTGATSHDSAQASAQARFRQTIIAFLSERFFLERNRFRSNRDLAPSVCLGPFVRSVYQVDADELRRPLCGTESYSTVRPGASASGSGHARTEFGAGRRSPART